MKFIGWSASERRGDRGVAAHPAVGFLANIHKGGTHLAGILTD
jgi:hypothetical protein